MNTDTRSYVHCPATPASYMPALLGRGLVNINLAEAAASYEGTERTPACVANNIRASVGMFAGQMLGGAVKTSIDGDVLKLRVIEGAKINAPAPDSLPRHIKSMLAGGKKFTPTVAQALVAAGVDGVVASKGANELKVA